MKRFLFAAAATLTLNAAPVLADTIYDTTYAWNGSSEISAFGSPDTSTYGQTFAAPADNILTDFTFYVEGAATLQVQAQIYAWSGSLLGGTPPQGATGSALFTSAPFVIAPTGGVFVPETVNTGGVTLTAGQDYVALFTISGPDPTDYPNSSGTDVWGDLPFTHVAGNGGGGFNFYNNGSDFAALNTTSWDDFQDFGDLAWTADFTASVPEPASLALLGVGLAGLSLLRRRKAA